MAWRRSVISKPTANVGDAYSSLAQLLKVNVAGVTGYRVPNGLVAVSGNPVTVVYGAQPDDLAAGAGQSLAVGSGISLDSTLDAAWDLNEIWLRNTTPTFIGVVVLNGPVFKGQDD